ncbi:hypothetical protein [Cereibacter changlensis]|uniref:hypothetical protein n=1 Tax=Cereibacter changlensis TaxID=402884 RepID=UPI0040338000
MSDRSLPLDSEDVLSSIRKLVAEDPRLGVVAAREPAKAEPGKLLLTPALRIVEPRPAGELHHLHLGPASRVDLPKAAAEDWQPEEEAPEAPHTFAGDDWQEDNPISAVIEAVFGQQPEPEAAKKPEPVTAPAEPEPAAEPAPAAEPLVLGAPRRAEPAALPEAAGEEFDAAMLREVIREVIREELRGPLGEQITDNVRKLVRAEIIRARG